MIPVLAGQGAVLVDAQAHKTIYEGCTVARGAGATLHRVRSNDPTALEETLRSLPSTTTRLFCMDGVNSMTGNVPDLPRVRANMSGVRHAPVCRRRPRVRSDRRVADPGAPYGRRGNSIVRHLDETYDNIVLVGGFSKSYSSLLAFLALPTQLKNHLKVAAAPYLYSGPSPTASLATVLAGFRVNEAEGDDIRLAWPPRPPGSSIGSLSSASTP